LCIIWAGFLLPSRRDRTSPASSVEEFERKMSILAGTNKPAPGRWVLMPDKHERLMGARERNRQRVRRRRKVLMTVLVELTALTLIMGLFPPLRMMLYATAALGFLVLVFLGILLWIRADEIRSARARRIRMARERMELERTRYNGGGSYGFHKGHATAYRGSNGHGSNGYVRNGRGANRPGDLDRRHAFGGSNGNGFHRAADEYSMAGNGHSNGHANGHSNGYLAGSLEEDYLRESGIRIIDDDVHVIVRRVSDVDREALEAAGR
jgi:hypothetical protein